jgi:(2Fe-2S) ferredoxin
VKRDKVWVCRGCCCGTRKKHPGIDHKALEKQLRRGAKHAGARFEVTDCLGPCGQGNVVVVRSQGVVQWFRKVNSAALNEAVLGLLDRSRRLPSPLETHLMPKRTGKKPRP